MLVHFTILTNVSVRGPRLLAVAALLALTAQAAVRPVS